MKTNKNLSIIALAVFGLGMLFSCTDSTNELTGNENTAGLLAVNSPLVGYTVGNGNTFEYPATFTISQGEVRATSVDVYKSFTNIAGVKSNEVLLKTVTLSPTEQREVVTFKITYNELISGLTVAGVPLSSDDTTLNIGDAWKLRYVAKTPSGDHANIATTKVAVGTRLAGEYKCVEGLYMRNSNVFATTINWPAKTVIESVNATTYRVVERFGQFGPAADDNTWYFKVVANVISYPALEPDGATSNTANGLPIITCGGEAPGYPFLPQFNCGNTNKVILDNVNGKDRLVMTVGYHNPGGGAPGIRQVYQVLEKL
ncbi:hypothetical protein [Flavobacterium sp.]|uniref:hypothetical protein n=1 Tax=Flavobacterium sp. TaxID=239 RepID=UPI0037516F08